MSKSRARQFMETFLKEEEAGDGSLGTGSGPEVAQGAAALDDKDVKLPDAQPEAGIVVEKYMPHPHKMAEFLEAMDGMCDRYMDEADAEVFTPADDADKECVSSAKGMIGEAMNKMRAVK